MHVLNVTMAMSIVAEGTEGLICGRANMALIPSTPAMAISPADFILSMTPKILPVMDPMVALNATLHRRFSN